MFTFQKDNTQYLYHYTKTSTAINFILAHKRLRFSSMMETNDPKETKSWFLTPGTNENRDCKIYTPEYLDKLLVPFLQRSTRLLCFSTDRELTGNHLEDMPKRGFCKPRMWAQYGENHKGICLIFDSKILLNNFHEQFSDCMYRHNFVTYRDRLIAEIQLDPAFLINIDSLEKHGAKEYAYVHLNKYIERLYFEKASDWENENEYRIAVFEREDELFLNYRNALKGIIFGQDCNLSDRSEIIEMTKSWGVIWEKLNWRNCTPWFDFKNTL